MRKVFLNYAANHGKFYNAAANASLKVDPHWERLGERTCSPDNETFGKIVQTSVEFTLPSSEFWFTSGTFGVERSPPFGNFCRPRPV